MSNRRKTRLLTIIGPGILIAATGVGTGDLVTGAIAPGKSGLGLGILWAVAVGAFLKFLLNEGLARWQLATGDTLLEGAIKHLGRPVQYIFLVYLLFWSYFTGSALMGACGVTAHAIYPLNDSFTDKILYGISHSVLAVVLVQLGGFRLFEKMMSVCIALMFVTVMITAIIIKPSWTAVAAGFVPGNLLSLQGVSLEWTIALIGGVGGTLTVLCYGYWIREEGRQGLEDLTTCRIDLATGYTMTALFGAAMVIIGNSIQVEGKGAGLLIQLSEQLRTDLGDLGIVAQWAFLIGAWGAIFSSMFGVWQCVPYLFADFWEISRRKHSQEHKTTVTPNALPYRIYLYGIASIPALGLWGGFAQVQKLYAIVGALFIPMLAMVLLILNGNKKWIGERGKNSVLFSLLLVLAMLFFLLAGWFELRRKFF